MQHVQAEFIDNFAPVPSTAPSTLPQSQSDRLDAPFLRAVADLADTRGAATFTPGGGVRFSKPLSKDERATLPAAQKTPSRFLDLPLDRFQASYNSSLNFRALVDRFTIPHIQPGYRLVLIPLSGGLTASQLRAIADVAESFGHGTIRLTADVSIRLPNVAAALLRPLFAALTKAGLLETPQIQLAA
jgi:hypothetical protein